MGDHESDENTTRQWRRLAATARLGAVERGNDFADDVLTAMLERMTAVATLMNERCDQPWSAIDDVQAPLLLADVRLALRALRMAMARTNEQIGEARALAKGKQQKRKKTGAERTADTARGQAPGRSIERIRPKR